jgi:hypothetical protein
MFSISESLLLEVVCHSKMKNGIRSKSVYVLGNLAQCRLGGVVVSVLAT